MFAFNNVPVTELALPGLKCREINPSVAGMRGEMSTIDIRLSVTPVKTGLRAMITFKADVFTESKIARVKDQFLNFLSKLRQQKDENWRQ